MEKVRAAYLQFVQRVPFYGLAVLCIDNVNVRALLPHVNKRFVTYGTAPDADWQARELARRGPRDGLRGLARRRAPRHGAAPHAGTPPRAERARGHRGRATISASRGGSRRTRSRSSAASIAASRSAARSATSWWSTTTATTPRRSAPRCAPPARASSRRLVVAFQPHRYSRTRDLFDEFLGAFDDADLLVLTEIYPAGERPDARASAARRSSRRSSGAGISTCASCKSRERLADALLDVVRSGDLVLTARRRRHLPHRGRAARAAPDGRGDPPDPLT